MKNNDLSTLEKIQQTVTECTKKPELYLSVQDHLYEDLKKSTKRLYDLAVKSDSLKSSKPQALPKLIVKGFDTEQIWQQIELANNEVFSQSSLGNISKILASNKSWSLPFKVGKGDESENSESENEDADDPMSDRSSNISINETDNAKTKKITCKVKKKRRNTEVDDKFFKLDELDEFLKKEDKKESKGSSKLNDSSDEDNESIDLFNNLSGLEDEDDDDDEEQENEIKNGKSLKYADFFDSPESGDEAEQRNDGENEEDDRFMENNSDNESCDINKQKDNKEKKQVKFNLLDNSDESVDSMEDVHMKEPEAESKIKTQKSSLETRQERLQKRIKELEGEAIAEKPWQLKGETSALSRPQNSLLEEFVEFDTVTRPAPVMTEQTTMKLEDIIRARIKDKVWDDVVKKFKPVETPMEYKKKLIMNQEKSKESLAQIYENEYIKQREALNADDKEEQEKPEPPEHIEIREKMHSLFRKLDALSNFHYTPKPAKPEIKIVSNIPAINMEEVAPVATSDATLLAPEEVKSKQKGDLIGKSERTKTDMKRERRKKKLKQHARAVHQSKKVVENVKRKKDLKTVVEKVKGRNILSADDSKGDGKSIKSSTAFFAQLQDQVESTIKAKTKSTTSKKNKNTMSAVKLKL